MNDNFQPDSRFKRFLQRRSIDLMVLSIGALGVIDAMWIEPGWLRVSQVKVGEGRPTHRIVHFTDFHYKGDARFAQRVIEAINRQQPDFVCFTGDLAEDVAHGREALKFIRQIKVPVYGVSGNHEQWCDAPLDALSEAFGATGGAWLRNERVMIADPQVEIVGWADLVKGPELPPARVKRVLLTHYPEMADRLGRQRFDLILSGHTHGGQLRLPFYGALTLPMGAGRYDRGLFKTPAGPLYVGAGLGTFFVPCRFCCRPEITVIEF
jgi:predicted MPP superfamily phosphohydrolase